MQMTEQAKEIRGEVLDEAADRYGRDKVASWADDPVKVRILNALAQMEADERVDT